MKKTTLVFGASVKEDRYANKAIKMLRAHQIDTKAFGIKPGTVADVSFDTSLLSHDEIDTVTLYSKELPVISILLWPWQVILLLWK